MGDKDDIKWIPIDDDTDIFVRKKKKDSGGAGCLVVFIFIIFLLSTFVKNCTSFSTISEFGLSTYLSNLFNSETWEVYLTKVPFKVYDKEYKVSQIEEGMAKQIAALGANVAFIYRGDDPLDAVTWIAITTYDVKGNKINGWILIPDKKTDKYITKLSSKELKDIRTKISTAYKERIFSLIPHYCPSSAIELEKIKESSDFIPIKGIPNCYTKKSYENLVDKIYEEYLSEKAFKKKVVIYHNYHIL